MKINSLEFKIYIANMLLILLILYIDLLVPTDIATSIPYVVTILIAISLPSIRYIMFFSILSTILTVMGHYLSTPGGIEEWQTITNRSISLAVIWFTTGIAIYRKNIILLLQKSENDKKLIFSSLVNPVITLNNECSIQSASESIQTYFGWEQKEIIGKDIFFLLEQACRSKYQDVFSTLSQVMSKQYNVHKSETIGLHKNQSTFPCEMLIRKITEKTRDNDNTIYTVILRDLSEQKSKEEKLAWLANNDALTGVYNRRFFDEHINLEWRRSMRTNSPLSLIMLDIDYFKKYNDSLGHQAGDICLQTVADVFKNILNRPSDYATRYGGEEFAVILGDTDSKGAILVAKQLRQQILDLNIPHPESELYKTITASMGVSTMIASKNLTADNLIKQADMALYQAKEKGRNNFQVYSENIDM